MVILSRFLPLYLLERLHKASNTAAKTITIVGCLVLCHSPVFGEPVSVSAIPIALNEADRSHVRVGKLTYRGGLLLSSHDKRFGGLSDLLVTDDGTRFLAISDKGSRVETDIAYDNQGNLAGIDNVDLSSWIGVDGQPLKKKKDADAEAIARGRDGSIFVAFERRHRIWRYVQGQSIPQSIPSPKGLSSAPRNSGIEALTMLDDGHLFALCEGCGTDKIHIGWIGDGNSWAELAFAGGDGFKPKAATTLPGGDVLVLERQHLGGGESVRVRRIAKETIRPGAMLYGNLIAEIQPPLTTGNMEGIAARRGPKGETLVYLLSDDDFKPVTQRTLLLMFELGE